MKYTKNVKHIQLYRTYNICFLKCTIRVLLNVVTAAGDPIPNVHVQSESSLSCIEITLDAASSPHCISQKGIV